MITMTDSCCSSSSCPPKLSNVPATAKAACPTNQKVGKLIDTLTLKALLALPLNQVTHHDYRFCPDPNCPTVYYSFDGAQLITEANLREKVYQKHPDDDDNLVCYCFQHTVGGIREEITRTGSSSVIEKIKTGIQAGQCACDIRNPQGDCCLGNVLQLVKQILVDVEATAIKRSLRFRSNS